MSEDKDYDLINEIGLLFLDAMSVKCDPSSYAIGAISAVRSYDKKEKLKMSKAYTVEEARANFLNAVRSAAFFWEKVKDKTDREKLDGLCFSILNIFDGTSMGFPAVDLVMRPHPDNKQFRINENTSWYENGMVINDDVMLHEIWHRK